MTEHEMIALAAEEGFSAAAVTGTENIVFDPSFRPYCEENLCGQYDANYSCPPVCGTPEQMKQRVLAHSKALVLQTIWPISDFTDKAAIRKAKNGHNTASLRLMEKLRSSGHNGFVIGASGCALCSPCAITQGKPCTFPDKSFSCMSAYCIYVKALTDAVGMDYLCKNGLLAFFGMYVFD